VKNIVKLILILCAAMAFSAHADVIDFEDIAEGAEGTNVVSGGFRFIANNAGAIYVTGGSRCEPPCASNGTRTLLAAGTLLGYADQVTMSRASGGDFKLTSIDAAELFSAPFLADGAAQINFMGLFDGALVTSGSLVLDQIVDGVGGLDDFQRFALSGLVVDTFIFTGIGSFTGNDGFTLDNLVVELVGGGPDPDPDPGEVPEPGTVALGALGLIGMAGARRLRPAACPAAA
jgi:hypothetical protein